ncbi:hypothetical protein A3K93_02310 [Acinetobacter sp. NCu2D-2]|uniref:putative pilus system protein FilF n=1 Tax=Acinetobacter sp. NCu2D-2 TaxID=1608473 RepID=UPI0007CDA9D2|nr:hypothetical protein [Acinetobacter sp. NCu2D-2]ANF81135.1 hypothetical protein A3K93_02310 [Acinetobacter sp. NCu2D-2]
MNNKKLFIASTLTAMLFALNGCGGESANVLPEKNDSSTESGSCTAGATGCIEFALDYPIDGLNFYCGTDTENDYITVFDLNNGYAKGACKAGENITFYLNGAEKHKIELGRFSLDKIGNVSTESQVPRLSIMDIAEGIRSTGSNSAVTISTQEIAIRLIQIIQTIGLNVNPPQSSPSLNSATDLQPIVINDSVRTNLDKILKNISVDQFKNTTDSEFQTLLAEWIDISQVERDDAIKVLDKLSIITNAAVYQPEFSLFSTSDLLNSYLSGSEGFVGCEIGKECKSSNTNVEHVFGHFMLMTDRQGRTFGSGLQWRGTPQNSSDPTKGFETLGGLNAQLIRQVAPIQMTAPAQKTWISPSTKSIPATPGFIFKTDETEQQTLTINQGRLYNDYMIAGTERFYKLLTNKKSDYTLTDTEKKELGLWKQSKTQVQGGTSQLMDTFAGSLDLYKIFPISYLDSRIFKSQETVKTGENYLFPLYGQLDFTFTDSQVLAESIPVVIDENGDIRTNYKPASAASECDVDFNPETLVSTYGSQTVEQFPIGTVSRAFVGGSTPQTTDNSISLRMILGNKKFGNLDGALIGMNTTIQASTSTTDAIVVGGALLKLDTLLRAAANSTPSSDAVPLIDSAGKTVRWANSFASFNKVYSTQKPDDTNAKDIAKRAGGEVKFKLASCYRIKQK